MCFTELNIIILDHLLNKTTLCKTDLSNAGLGNTSFLCLKQLFFLNRLFEITWFHLKVIKSKSRFKRNHDHIEQMCSAKGTFPSNIFETCKKAAKYLDRNGTPLQGSKYSQFDIFKRLNSTKFSEEEANKVCNLLNKMLELDERKRSSAKQCLNLLESLQ